MKMKKLDEKTVKYFLGETFKFVEILDLMEYGKDNKPTGNVIGSKVRVLSPENPTEVISIKLDKMKDKVKVPNVFETINFNGLTGSLWVKQNKGRTSIEVSLKADDVTAQDLSVF